MFWRLFCTNLKVMLRNRSTIFWIVAFPFVLGGLFKLAFNNFNDELGMQVIKIAVVNDAEVSDELHDFVYELDKEEDFEVSAISLDDAKTKLLADEIDVAVSMNDKKTELLLAKSAISGSVTKMILERFVDGVETANKIAEVNVQYLINGEFTEVVGEDFVENTTNGHFDLTVNYFYTLIAMAALFSSMIGLEITKNSEANLSKKGARLAMSPTKKSVSILAATAAGFVIAFTEQVLLYLYIRYVLDIHIAERPIESLAIAGMGVIAGLSLGIFVGASNTKAEGYKDGILMMSTLLCCFFSGMMGAPGLRDTFDRAMPGFSKINPINSISDGFYSLFAYDDMAGYWDAFMRISIFALVMIVLALVFSRRKKYDSI